MLHDPAGHDAQRGPRIYLNAVYLGRPNIPYEVQGSIMLPFNLHIVNCEGNAGSI